MTKRAVIITTSIIVTIILVFAILFGAVFRVRKIDLKYGEDFVYRAQVNDILTAGNVKKNESIFSVNRDEIASNIETAYPYARVSVNISSFISIKIKLSNRTALYYFVQEGVYYILDEDCKILEISTESQDAQGYILLTDVFSVSETTTAGQFLTNKYTSVCCQLYKAIYANAMLNLGNDSDGDGIADEQYLTRDDMCNIVTNIKFDKVSELSGQVDRLIISTSYGTKLTIVEPQNNLNLKVNMAFSALRQLILNDETNATDFATKGSINVVYNYEENNNLAPTPVCEYRAS